MRTNQILLLTSVGVLLVALPLNAAVIYSTFGSTPPGYSTGSPYGLSDNSVFAWNEEFSPTSSGTLQSIDLELSTSSEDINGASVYVAAELLNDAGGAPGSTDIADFTPVAVPLSPDGNTVYDLLTLDSTSNPTLSAGTNYWLAVYLSSDVNGAANWVPTNSGATTVLYYFGGPFGGGAPVADPAFDVNSVSAVPEPATLAIGGAGLLALVVFRKRLVVRNRPA